MHLCSKSIQQAVRATAVAMPVEIVQFCWKYNLGRLQNLPEVGVDAVQCKVARNAETSGRAPHDALVHGWSGGGLHSEAPGE